MFRELETGFGDGHVHRGGDEGNRELVLRDEAVELFFIEEVQEDRGDEARVF